MLPLLRAILMPDYFSFLSLFERHARHDFFAICCRFPRRAAITPFAVFCRLMLPYAPLDVVVAAVYLSCAFATPMRPRTRHDDLAMSRCRLRAMLYLRRAYGCDAAILMPRYDVAAF